MPVSFDRIREYLNKVGAGADSAPHGKFWNRTYKKFLSDDVPGVDCNGMPIPIINHADFEASGFLVILENTQGLCQNPQMPAFAKKLTEPGYSIALSDGSPVSGAQILSDIHEWLAAQAPENPLIS